jgi:alkanesulfonate monooxygenase SsuD/methylene tetrahydromethanopterin reductase-like flavin-dependent oxidoreductase (luciferase family)
MGIEPGWGFAVNSFYRDVPAETADMIRLPTVAEEAGWDSVWVGDHLLWHAPMVDGLTQMVTFAASTSRIKIGSAILLLGLRHPTVAARMLTSLNVLSEGRLILGVGVGGENPAEFEFSGVPYERRGKVLDESLEFLVSQWEERQGEEPRIEPAGDPFPLLIGGRSDAARRRIKRFGAGWLAAFVSPDRIRAEQERLNEESGTDVPIVFHAYMRSDKDGDRARAEAADFLGNTVYAMPAKRLMDYSFAGTPEECAERISSYVDAGVRQVIVRVAGWDQREQLEQWSEEIMPLLPNLKVSG